LIETRFIGAAKQRATYWQRVRNERLKILKTLETIGGYLLMLGAAYCGWRALLLGAARRAAWREKVLGKPEPPISILNDKNSSK
jgi:hypothetical protein